jgi:hypothetical protein
VATRILEAVHHEDPGVRKAGLSALPRALSQGNPLGVQGALDHAADDSAECRAAALLVLRELAHVGKREVLMAVLEGVQDPDRSPPSLSWIDGKKDSGALTSPRVWLCMAKHGLPTQGCSRCRDVCDADDCTARR